MAAARFNTLNFTRRLRAAGVPEAQAEAFADALSEDAIGELASKSDVEGARRDLKQEIESARRELKREIEELRRELADLRRDLAEQGKDLRAEMRDLENRLVIKLGAMMAAIAALLFAGLKLSH